MILVIIITIIIITMIIMSITIILIIITIVINVSTYLWPHTYWLCGCAPSHHVVTAYPRVCGKVLL